MPIVKCSFCGKEKKIKPSKIAEHNYCSQFCMSNSRKGIAPWNKGKKGVQISPMKGKHHTQESKIKMSEICKLKYKNGYMGGFKIRKLRPESYKKVSETLKGHIPWNKGKIGLQRGRKGEKSNFWKGGITPLNLAIRSSTEFKLWRKSIFERDKYICRMCGSTGKANLVAHHLWKFSEFPELRFAINNGITLCEKCHKKIHKNNFRRN